MEITIDPPGVPGHNRCRLMQHLPEIPYFQIEVFLCGVFALALGAIHLWRVIRSELCARECMLCEHLVPADEYPHHLEMCLLRSLLRHSREYTRPCSPKIGHSASRKKPFCLFSKCLAQASVAQRRRLIVTAYKHPRAQENRPHTLGRPGPPPVTRRTGKEKPISPSASLKRPLVARRWKRQTLANILFEVEWRNGFSKSEGNV